MGSEPSTYVVKIALDDVWMDVGRGLVGAHGPPRLVGTGPLTAASTASLEITGAPAGALVLLTAGRSFDDVPLQGGLLVALPTAGVPPEVASPLGVVSIDVPLSVDVLPGLTMYTQAWIVDDGGPGLRGDERPRRDDALTYRSRFAGRLVEQGSRVA